MATKNQPTVKISALAKELKMKSGKEIVEILKTMGYDDIKSSSANISEEQFNKLMENLKDRFITNGITIEQYLNGEYVISEFSDEAQSEEKKIETKPEVKPTVKPESKKEVKTEKKQAPKTEKKPVKQENKAEEPKKEVKAKVETKPEHKVEVKAENKPAPKAEPKSEPKKEAVKAEIKPEIKHEVKEQSKTEKAQEIKPQPKTEKKAEAKIPANKEKNQENVHSARNDEKKNQKERVFTPPTQQPKKEQKPHNDKNVHDNKNKPVHNQGEKLKGGVNLNVSQATSGNSNKRSRVVDTRGTSVDLSKYDEKFENLASKASKDFGDSRGGRVVDGRKRSGKLDKERMEADRQRKQQMEKARKLPVSVSIPDEITVGELASRLKITAADIIKKLFMLGVMATVNQTIDYDTAFLIADEMGANVTKEVVVSIEDKLFEEEEDSEENLITRAPVVCVMGHVDHGKTSLLDAIRHTKVTRGEAGGITQHIGAYRVKVKGEYITFLDTPGHEAFTSMRARGAKATDIAILVVAADDGIMPQTVEAINHAKAAGVDIVVAINKMDKPTANPDNIKQALTQYELVPEEWGGDVICVPVSALTGEGIQDLLETIQLIAEVKEFKANPKRRAKGVVIEAKLDKGRGPVTTVLVQNGTLNIGDTVIAGTAVGRVKAMINDNGKKIKSAGPSVPVEIDGLSEVPIAGDEFNAVENERMARELADQRKAKIRDEKLKSSNVVNLEALFENMGEGETKELNIIVKADVTGSAEAVKASLVKLSNEEVKVNVIHSAAGGIVESDVMLASASKAIIVGFNVRPDKIALESAEKQGVDIRTYRVIYDCIEEITAAMKGMLAPTFRESLLGHAEVRQAIHVPKVGLIAGCYVTDGKVVRNCNMRILRDSILLCEDKLASLRRFKDDVKEVAEGYECGVGIEHFNDIKEGDILEFYEMVEVER